MSASEVSSRLRAGVSSRLEQIGVGAATRENEWKFRSVKPWVQMSASEMRSSYVSAAEQVIHGTVRSLGATVEIGSPSFDWNRDPLTQVRAPMTFGPTLNIHSRQTVGDIKYLWEPNRHLALVTLAMAYEQSGDKGYRDHAIRLISAWLQQCPYPRGPNWSSGLEVGIRLINWALIWQLLGFDQTVTDVSDDSTGFRNAWLPCIYQHVHFTRKHYSRNSSANNHLIGEATGVFVACCTWPYWSDFERWRLEALDILADQALVQSYPDGVTREQTTSYQLFVLQLLLISVVVGRTAGLEFSAASRARILAMLHSLADLRDAAGNMPMIGDNDDGHAIRLSYEDDFCPYASAFATGAVLFDDPELAQAAGKLDDQTRWLVGTSGWDSLLARGTAQRRLHRTSFSDAGYYILGRDLSTDDELRLLVDCGPLGYLSIAAHGHADALSIYLSVAGREFLVDPGTYTYHGKADWRMHFRGTRAHNTVTVDGHDQSVQAGNFMWLQHAKATCLRYLKSRHEDHFVGEHDGYQRLSDPVTHRREILRAGSTFQVTDTLVCHGEHSVEQWWQFSEHCVVTAEGGIVMVVNGPCSIRMNLPTDGSVVRVYRGSKDPIAGWVSRSYDSKVPATSVCVKTPIRGLTKLVTTIDCSAGQASS